MGNGGAVTPGTSIPFLEDEEPFRDEENRPFAFGADATLRRNRVAVAPIVFGDNTTLGFE